MTPAQVCAAHYDPAGRVREVTIGARFLRKRDPGHQGSSNGGEHQFFCGSHFVYSFYR
jgi:hypothetical protein